MLSIKMPANNFTSVEIDAESERLSRQRLHVDCELGWQWNYDTCHRIAPPTLKIHRLKMEKNVVILTHAYVGT